MHSLRALSLISDHMFFLLLVTGFAGRVAEGRTQSVGGLLLS